MFASLLITLIAIPFGSAVPAGPVALIERDGGYQFKGQATWYDDSVGLGACGWQNTPSQFVVAMNHDQYKVADCGKHVKIYNPSTGRATTAEVVDLCPGCKQGDLDMSQGLFGYLSNGNFDEGVFHMEWSFET